LFVEESEQAGLPPGRTVTWGISVGDLNGDGLPDVFANNHSLRHSFFRNDTDNPGLFTDVIKEIDAEGHWVGSGGFSDTHAGAWMDFDNDGDQDLLITQGVCCTPDLFVNDGGKLYY